MSISRNMIYNEDCLVGMRRIDDGSVDMILADLPYGTTKCLWDSVLPLDQLWAHYLRVIKPNGAIVLTAQSPFTEILGASKIELLRYKWIWEKSVATGFLNARRMPLKAHEDILVFYKKLPIYNPVMTTGHPRKSATKVFTAVANNHYGKQAERENTYDSTERYPRSVLRFPKETQKLALHPTQKPVALFEYLIRTYTRPGELVLDNCMGSGTTAVACINSGRDFLGFENDTEFGYFDISLRRIKQARELQAHSAAPSVKG